MRRAFFALIPLALALSQTDSLRKITFEQFPALKISSGALDLTVLLQGSTIAELVLKDDPEKLSPIWNPMRLAREAGQKNNFDASIGHFVCVDGFGPVSKEEQAAGLEGHGEAHRQTFQVVSSGKQGNVTTVALNAKLPVVEESFTRTFRVVDGENVVYVNSQLENLLGFDRPVNWAEHATIGSPFLESGITVVDASGSRSQTRPYQGGRNGQLQRRLASGEDFTWPMAPATDGSKIDLRTTPSNPHYLDHATTLLDPSRDLEWVTALNPARHLLIGYVFRRADYPWLQYWGNYPASGKFSRGLEFGTQPYDVSRREAISTGKMFDTPTYRWLPAKSKIESHFLVFYTRVPEGVQKIDDVRLENGQLTIEDRHAGKKITLKASLPL